MSYTLSKATPQCSLMAPSLCAHMSIFSHLLVISIYNKEYLLSLVNLYNFFNVIFWINNSPIILSCNNHVTYLSNECLIYYCNFLCVVRRDVFFAVIPCAFFFVIAEYYVVFQPWELLCLLYILFNCSQWKHNRKKKNIHGDIRTQLGKDCEVEMMMRDIRIFEEI